MSACIKDVFCFVAEPIKKYVVDQLILIVNVEEKVEAVAREAAILEKQLEDVQDQIQKDEAEGKKPTATVLDWLRRVNELQPSATAQSLQADYQTRNRMLWGTCSLNCFSSRSISKRAVDNFKLLHEESEFIKGVQNYTEEGPRPPVQLMSAMPIQFGRQMFETRLQEALDFLGDNHRGVLGICGMGGVGKTTLLEHINNTLEKNLSSLGFDKVIFVTASRESTPDVIQKELVKKLGLRVAGGDARTHIFNYLIEKSFVILLDDVWERQDLKEIGVPLPLGGVVGDQHKLTKRKLIITTRSRQVCSNMGAKKPINVECLSPEDARLLFRDNAGVDATSISCNPLIGEFADKVADECGGLPIALITIGRAMAGTESVPVWENALELLRTSKLSQIPGMDDPLPLLKYSYDCLKDPREKECLLHCALWPEDYRIFKDDLIRCWMGHGLLGRFDSVHKAYNTGHAIIDNLLKVCLLEDVKFLDEYTLKNEEVKLHDIIRDMVLWIARGCSVENDKKFVVLNGQQVKRAPSDNQTWSEVHKMSLINTDISTWPSEIQNCPNLTTLIVNQNRHLSSMSILKHSIALKYLDLSLCWGLKVFPIEVCGLSNLEYLNLSHTRISKIPEELKNLTNLKYLLLQNTGISIPVEVLSNLVNLLELDLFDLSSLSSHSSIIDHLHCLEGHLNALGINASSLLDFEKLVHLSGISIRALCVRRMEKLDSPSFGILSPKLLGNQNIYSSLKTLAIADLDKGLKELVIEGRCRLMALDSLVIKDAAGLKEIIWRGVKPAEVFPIIRKIRIVSCHQMRHVTWISNLPCLESLVLIDCDNMEHLLLVREGGAEAEESSSRLFFPSLRILQLSSLKKLSCIYDHALVFPALEYLDVWNCPQLMKLPFESPACCRNLKKITAKKQWWEETVQLEGNMRTFLEPSLHFLSFDL